MKCVDEMCRRTCVDEPAALHADIKREAASKTPQQKNNRQEHQPTKSEPQKSEPPAFAKSPLRHTCAA